MFLSGYHIVLGKVLRLAGFRLIRLVLRAVQTVNWALNGNLKRIREARRPENYQQCVQVMNIVSKYRIDVLKQITRSDFILTHARWESPDYIFKHDHVTLMFIDDDAAVFVESLPGQELWRCDFNSFIRFAQLDHGLRLLFVPIPAFLRMADMLGDPSQTIVFLFNTARCGSTLFTQMMEMTEHCVALSEPDVFTTLTGWYRKRGDTDEMRRLMKSSIRWVCRPYSTFKPDVTVIKLVAPSVFALSLIYDLYPNSKYLFMYRGVEKNAKSIYRIAQELPLLKIAFTLGRYSGFFVELFINEVGFPGKEFRARAIDDIDLAIYAWVVMVREYVRLRQSGFPASAICYEDIIEDRHRATKAMLEYCGLSGSLTENALRGLELDSQRNSPVSKEILAKYRDPEMTVGARKRGNELLKKNGLPLIGSDDVVEGTITHFK